MGAGANGAAGADAGVAIELADDVNVSSDACLSLALRLAAGCAPDEGASFRLPSALPAGIAADAVAALAWLVSVGAVGAAW